MNVIDPESWLLDQKSSVRTGLLQFSATPDS
jgi:hypothetical protein